MGKVNHTITDFFTTLKNLFVITNSSGVEIFTSANPAKVDVTTLPTLANVTNVATVATVSSATVQPKTVVGTITTSALTTATPYVQPAYDCGSNLLYTTFRCRFIFDQPVKVEFYHGASSTLTSNKIQRTDNIPANTPTVIDYPLLARYAGVKITNTGAATTTIHEGLYSANS